MGVLSTDKPMCVVGCGTVGLSLCRRILAFSGRTPVAIETRPERRRIVAEFTQGSTLPKVADLSMAVGPVFVVVDSPKAAVAAAADLTRMDTGRIYILTTLGPDHSAEALRLGAKVVQVAGSEADFLRGRCIAIGGPELDSIDETTLIPLIAVHLVKAPSTREASLIKLLSNMMIAYQFSAFWHLVELAKELDVDVASLSRMILEGTAGSPALQSVHHYPEGLAELHELLGVQLPTADPSQAATHLKMLQAELRHG